MNDGLIPAYVEPPNLTYEITWQNGHIERIEASQVTYPNNGLRLFGGRPDAPEIIEMHGTINGKWQLQLRANLDDIRTIRNLTTTESEGL